MADYSNKSDRDIIIETATKVESIREHLRVLNGSVARNTRWRYVQNGAIAVIMLVIGIFIKYGG